MNEKIEGFRELLESRVALREKRIEQYDSLGMFDRGNAASDSHHRMQEILDCYNEMFPKPQSPEVR